MRKLVGFVKLAPLSRARASNRARQTSVVTGPFERVDKCRGEWSAATTRLGRLWPALHRFRYLDNYVEYSNTCTNIDLDDDGWSGSIANPEPV